PDPPPRERVARYQLGLELLLDEAEVRLVEGILDGPVGRLDERQAQRLYPAAPQERLVHEVEVADALERDAVLHDRQRRRLVRRHRRGRVHGHTARLAEERALEPQPVGGPRRDVPGRVGELAGTVVRPGHVADLAVPQVPDPVGVRRVRQHDAVGGLERVLEVDVVRELVLDDLAGAHVARVAVHVGEVADEPGGPPRRPDAKPHAPSLRAAREPAGGRLAGCRTPSGHYRSASSGPASAPSGAATRASSCRCGWRSWPSLSPTPSRPRSRTTSTATTSVTPRRAACRARGRPWPSAW